MNGGGGGGGGGGGRGGADEVAASPALQVIVLGSGGGPIESNTTSFLVRSTASGWRKGSIVALDAGVHLGAIVKILEDTLPAGLGQSRDLPLPHTIAAGPFAGLEAPFSSVSANAAHIQSTLIDTYLITHPHLDHIAGFVINTAGLPGTRPKRLAGLPSTIAAFKAHIFNNVIWPNLSDENNGAGLVTYMRLVEGGSPALGDGDGRGYLEISDGLAVKIWGVSHGHCIERHSHRGSGTSTRFGSLDAGSLGTAAAAAAGPPLGLASPRIVAQHNATSASLSAYLRDQTAREQGGPAAVPPSAAGASGVPPGRSSISMGMVGGQPSPSESICVYDSSAYFVRDVATGREVLMFGDVEPDSVSLSPRNAAVWAEAGPKVAAGALAAIFIECSYDDSQSVDRLFGHLTPKYIVEELAVLAGEVALARAAAAAVARRHKRKREPAEDDGNGVPPRRKPTPSGGWPAPAPDEPVSPKTVKPPRLPSGALSDANSLLADSSPHLATPTAELTLREAELAVPALRDLGDGGDGGSLAGSVVGEEAPVPPLRGLTVVVIHVKERLKDGPSAAETVLKELLAHEEREGLGCEYVMSYPGQSLFF